MSLYRESTVSGSTYRRAYRVIMDNPLNAPPKVFYLEEDVLILANSTTTQALVGVPLGGAVDPSGVIELRDPSTKLPTGQYVSAAVVYAALYSDYLNRAEARDAAEAALLAATVSPDPNEVVVSAPDPTVDANG